MKYRITLVNIFKCCGSYVSNVIDSDTLIIETYGQCPNCNKVIEYKENITKASSSHCLVTHWIDRFYN